MKTTFIFLFCIVPLCIIVFGFSIGYTITVHPALAVVTCLLLCVGLYYFDQAMTIRKDKRIRSRLEHVFESIAATPTDETWKLEVAINRLKLFVMNPGLPFLLLMLSIEFDSQTRAPAVAGFCVYFFLYYVTVIAFNLPGLKSNVLVLSDDGIETFCNGFIPWVNIKNIELDSVNFKGVELKTFSIQVVNPETTLVKHHWKDRFLGLFRLGAKKNGIVRLSLDYASEDYDVVYTVANSFLSKKKGHSNYWRSKYFKKRNKPRNTLS